MSSTQMIRPAVAGVLLTVFLVLGARQLTPLPPLGAFLDPAGGIWSVARTARLPHNSQDVVISLGDDVRVVYDRRGVPHISASSIEDAVRALGYVVARDRLFQMDVSSRATAGRLTELVGARVIGSDRQQRSLGLSWSADRNLSALDPTSATVRITEAYAEGVNAWIDGIGRRDLPFEYRLLQVKPEHWAPIRSLHVFKGMGYTLTYSTHDLWRRQVAASIGEALTDAFFPEDHPIQEPIQPNGRDTPRYDYRRLPPPPELRGTPPHQAIARASAAPPAVGVGSSAGPAAPAPGRWWSGDAAAASARGVVGGGEIGSNNWAVSPQRSATGSALLSGDPHLGLSLPSIWYEVHIQIPGELDVYGVTIPGIPGVVIGFNRDVAWSFTNTGADVLDYYWETLNDTGASPEYLLDGEWRPLEQRIESYLGPNGEVLGVDTMYFTHRGPLTTADEETLSMRWTVLEDAGSMGTLLGIARARSVDEWLTAMESWLVPAQNGIVADRSGNIAIRSSGRYPIRAGNGSGTEIRDGALSSNDWQGYWPVENYPTSVNPDQGFLASANQQPIDPMVQAGYLGVNWPAPWRALRINALLRADSGVTVDAMRGFQTDPGNAKADLFVPMFLDAAALVLAREPDDTLAEALRLLRSWDRRYTKENERAVLFENAMRLLADQTWDELIPPGGNRRLTTPPQSILASLLQFPDDVWWDVASTENVVESRDDILAGSLRSALTQTKEEHGLPEDGGWRWDGIRHANIFHLLGLAALSALELPIQGGSGNLNPSSGNGGFGASWRMVVDLDNTVQAWVTYPGGQSGNPTSPWYDNRVDQWVNGTLDQVIFPASLDSILEADAAGVLLLRAEGR